MIFAGAKIQNQNHQNKSNNNSKNESILDTIDDVSLFMFIWVYFINWNIFRNHMSRKDAWIVGEKL